MWASALLVIGLNAAVDPYAITGAPRIAGLNEHKNLINDYIRLMKKYHPSQGRHNALIVGNSRVEMGLDPAHHCFREAGVNVYNLGVPGAPVQMQLAYALNVIYQQDIDTVFLSADLADFVWAESLDDFGLIPLEEYSVEGFELTAAGKPNPDHMVPLFLDYYRCLFSLDSLIASISTLVGQTSAGPDRDEAGYNPARDWANLVQIEGPRALFDIKFNELNRYFFMQWYMFDRQGRIDPSFADLAVFLDIAMKQGIKVYFLVNPFHQSYWDLLREGGHMPMYEEWLDELKAIVARYPAESVSFWDFSGDSPFVQEPVPEPGRNSAPLHWFWEPSHYRQELGDLMLDSMLSESCGTQVVFGEKVQ